MRARPKPNSRWVTLVPPFHRQSPRFGRAWAMARTESLPDMPVLEKRVPKIPSGSSRLAKTEKPHGHFPILKSSARKEEEPTLASR
jgi:hypothetical protein